MANNIEHVLCKFIVLVKTAFPRLFLSLAHLCTKTLTVTSLRSIQIGSIIDNQYKLPWSRDFSASHCRRRKFKKRVLLVVVDQFLFGEVRCDIVGLALIWKTGITFGLCRNNDLLTSSGLRADSDRIG